VANPDTSRFGLPTVLDRLAGLERRHRDRAFETLRTALLGGDRDAWSLIVEKYSRFVYTVALQLLSGAPQPEEAAASIYVTRAEPSLQNSGDCNRVKANAVYSDLRPAA